MLGGPAAPTPGRVLRGGSVGYAFERPALRRPADTVGTVGTVVLRPAVALHRLEEAAPPARERPGDLIPGVTSSCVG